MKTWLRGIGFLLAFSASAADLAAVKAEADPNKRSVRALDNAFAALDDARQAFHDGNMAKVDAALREVSDSVGLTYQALQASHQKPHRSKYYKRAELRLRELDRMISGFSQDLPFDQRGTATEVGKSVQAIHDKILVDELEKK